MYDVDLHLHCYNRGGMPKMFQHAHRQRIEEMRQAGEDEEKLRKAEEELKVMSQPVREQLVFFRSFKLPFMPEEGISLRFDELKVTPGVIEWDVKELKFQVHSHTQIDQGSDVLKKLMADDSGWEMLPPDVENQDVASSPCDDCDESSCGMNDSDPEF
jgi:hypothetical protein